MKLSYPMKAEELNRRVRKTATFCASDSFTSMQMKKLSPRFPREEHHDSLAHAGIPIITALFGRRDDDMLDTQM